VARLVGLALGDRGGDLLGLGLLGLQGRNPVIAFGGVGSLEGVLVAGNGEVEDGGALGLDVGNLRLDDIRKS
jgi:hypothetical protein